MPIAPPPADPVSAGVELDALLADGGVSSVLQPVVDLRTGAWVGFEALARGPVGHPLRSPDALFAAARAAGRLTALDRTCVGAGLHAAERAGLREPWTLFVNLEPDSRTLDVLPDRAPEGVRVVVELTERALLDDLAAVLAAVDHVRSLGWGVALDDVGVEPASLALLPLVRPDVVKLDASVVQGRPGARTAALFSAVAAESERSGSVVLAEGIETEQHLAAAAAVGAHLGQGYLFGRPGTFHTSGLDAVGVGPGVPLGRAGAPASPRTPFDVATATRPSWRSDGSLLIAMSRHLEREAAALGDAAIILTTFQRHEAFLPVASRYADLARRTAFVGAFGVGMPDEPAPGVRGVALDADDPLAPEWDLVVLGPHFAALLAARPAPGEDTRDGPAGHSFDYVLSHDRALVVDAARALAAHVRGARAA